VPGFLETHYAWNRGVSFSLFWQNGTIGSSILTAFLLLAMAMFVVWATRTTRPLAGTALGMILGGAVGNFVDRTNHTAVFDFLVVRLGATPLFICNSADIFISIGVVIWIADYLFAQRDDKVSTQPS
jgi:signal peptidase II